MAPMSQDLLRLALVQAANDRFQRTIEE
ncbi:hypothetical protein PLUA15_500043 [Pseudomonas lundensis]|uniref:Uncharacterized protein n=1 Tax=Pseudomonas lundensis TaxID=86185 RepID=A0AAX2HEC1_9PSED|nr:hypothetical protein PLUA15_500043 [Pseudomonas lundensis]